jgi:hypothetical protein
VFHPTTRHQSQKWAFGTMRTKWSMFPGAFRTAGAFAVTVQ